MGALVLRPAAERFITRSPGVETRHGFSFGAHYDPAHVAHGRLVVTDEHLLDADAGFPLHPHRDVEVVSWVLAGTLLHEHDRTTARVPVGTLQRLSAGTGVVHAERAAAVPTRFLQVWRTAPPGGVPAYEQAVAGGLAEVFPGVWAGRLDGGWTLPDRTMLQVFVATGSCELAGTRLGVGDALRLTDPGGSELTGRCEVLVVDAGDERAP